jgi:hypothetical protein
MTLHSGQTIAILSEPELEFRYKQRLVDPRDGLSIFGPYDADLASHPANIVYAAIGCSGAIAKLARWSERFVGPIPTDARNYDCRNWPHFPGFEAAYCTRWPREPACVCELDANAIREALRYRDDHKRTAKVVDMFLGAIDAIAKRDEDYGVVLCIVPDDIWLLCRSLSKVQDGIGVPISEEEQRSRAEGPDLFGTYDPDEYRRSPDFRRQLKARALAYGIPLQIIKESTLDFEPSDDTGLSKESPKSIVAWCLSTGIYYKAGGKPWRLCSAREGVCYVGLAFRRAQGKDHRTACCAAQMFLDSGDGIVFKGETGPWYSRETRECHLDTKAAHDLLKGVLETYKQLGGKPLTEVFLHSRSDISDEEFQGYQKACPSGVSLVGVRVRIDHAGFRLFRIGDKPVLRGSFLLLSDTSAYLWGSGFKLRLETYDGWDVPLPLRIDVQHGHANVEQVARDILGLTKLNYNSCRLGGAQPITVSFSDKVGEILVSNPGVKNFRPQFKFYI